MMNILNKASSSPYLIWTELLRLYERMTWLGPLHGGNPDLGNPVLISLTSLGIKPTDPST